MLCSTKQLDGFVVAATDCDLGKVSHAFFDDERWVIRHLVVQTGNWLSGRTVLISPHAVQGMDTGERRLMVQLTGSQVEQAPDIDTAKPVSRQQEERLHDHYGYPYYWAGAGAWGLAAYPLAYVPAAGAEPMDASGDGGPALTPSRRTEGDPHLRSTLEVEGYHIEATDGAIGHVEEFLVDPASWAIRYIVVDTRNWLPGRKVLVTPAEIDSIDWSRHEVRVQLTREAIKSRPDVRQRDEQGAGITA